MKRNGAGHAKRRRHEYNNRVIERLWHMTSRNLKLNVQEQVKNDGRMHFQIPFKDKISQNVSFQSLLYFFQNGKCAYCHTPFNEDEHLDHVTPIAKKGANDITNIVLTCWACNNRKNDTMPTRLQRSRHNSILNRINKHMPDTFQLQPFRLRPKKAVDNKQNTTTLPEIPNED